MTPAEEARAVRIASARARCRVNAMAVRNTHVGPRAAGHVTCADGWSAARLLLALAVEDAKTAGARDLALEIRGEAASDDAFARAVHRYVLENVRFVREPGEVFTGSSYTIAAGSGDCDDHARVVYAILRAGGLPARMAFLYKKGARGPSHVVVQAAIGGAWQWLETTIPAAFGEHPYAAGMRVGVLSDRTDLGTEVRTMTENDLPPVPVDFDLRNPAPLVQADAQALEGLGFLCVGDVVENASDATFRRAVQAFQLAHGLTPDGLIGPVTRAAMAKVSGLPTMGAVAPAKPAKTFTHETAREILRRTYVRKFGRDPSPGELDFAASTAYFESGYGRYGGADWAKPAQFAQWAARGRYNWGAIERGTPPCEGVGGCPGKPVEKAAGVDAGRGSCFCLYATDDDAADAFWIVWGSADTLAAAAANDAHGVAAAMKRHGYYEGFWRPPGGLTGSYTAARGFKEAESAEDAEARNIADYAGALQRFRSIVTKPGGVPDPSPEGLGGAGVVMAGALIALALGAAWHIVHS